MTTVSRGQTAYFSFETIHTAKAHNQFKHLVKPAYTVCGSVTLSTTWKRAAGIPELVLYITRAGFSV